MPIETKKSTPAIPSDHGDSIDNKKTIFSMGTADVRQAFYWNAIKPSLIQKSYLNSSPPHSLINDHFLYQNSGFLHIDDHQLNKWAQEINSKVISKTGEESNFGTDIPTKNRLINEEFGGNHAILRNSHIGQVHDEYTERHLNSPIYNHMEFLIDLSKIVKEIKSVFHNPSITYEFDPNEDFINLTIKVVNIHNTIEDSEILKMEKILHTKLQDLVSNKEIFNNIIIDVL